MKLTEKQAFQIIHKIEHYFGFKQNGGDVADFVMTELINMELVE